MHKLPLKSNRNKASKYLLLGCALAVITACSGQDNKTGNLTATGDVTAAQSDTAEVKIDGIRLVEEITKSGDELVIPYSKYVLDNGLTVVLHPDNSDPLVHVDVTYHVGSGREEIGRSGFAHFFEHMMFQGSENVADEQHFKTITEAGGTLNGTTNADRTNYFETVPANQLEKMLWLEADRMGYFLNAVTEEKFEVQRETVKNERGQRVDNQAYGLLFERVGEAQFPQGHPYSWSTIGYIEDLNRANLDDLKRFFLKWYGPNNAVITIGGDLDKAQTLAWVKKYFGNIPRGPEIPDVVKAPVTLDADRYISLEDKSAQLPLLYMSWPTVYANHPDEAPLDVLYSIMGEGQTSLLYKNLQKPGLTVQAAAGHGCRELSCSFTLFALANPSKVQSLADMETIIRESLVEFEGRGVEDDDIERVKASIISGQIYGLESVSGKVSNLAAYQTFRGTPNGIGADITRYETVTKADVMRVYNQYIKGKPAVIMSIVPQGGLDMIAKADTWQRPERVIPEQPANEAFEWSLPVDDFDRSQEPQASGAISVKAPRTYESQLKNDIPILGAINDEVPTTTIELRLEMGQSYDPIDKVGLASMTAGLLNEATLDSTAEDLSNRLDKLGSSVSVSAGENYTTLRIRSLTDNLDETIAIAKEKFLRPKFDPEDFERDKSNTLQNIIATKTDANATASAVFNQRLYGQDNSFAYPIGGTETTVNAISLEDVKVFYSAHYSPKIASFTVVSNLDQDAVTSALKPFSDWSGGDVNPPEPKPYPPLDSSVIYFIDKPGAPQSEIRIGRQALPFDATGEYYRARIMNFPLGGAFNSRVNLNLREEKGYTYGAFTFFSGQKARGFFQASAGVRSDATLESVQEFLKEITQYYQSGITDDELNFTQSALGQSEARQYETPAQKLRFLNRMQSYNLAPSFVDEQNSILKSLSEAELDGFAKKYLNPDDMMIVIMGDKATQMDKLKAIGRRIIELDADGNVIQ